MKLIQKGIKFLTQPAVRMTFLSSKGLWYRSMPDEEYLRRLFKLKMGYDLDLDDPKTFNEKLQWLKIHDRDPEYTTMVDKYAAKKWVADRIGEEYIIPTLGVWDHFDDIDFDALPDQFVLKCTHDSGGIVIVKDKAAMDKKAAKKKLEKCLRRNYYWGGREWPYKNVPPRIIAEKFMADESGNPQKDYKVYNFDGEPKVIQVDYDRFSNRMSNLFSADWNYLDVINAHYPNNPVIEDRPDNLNEMLRIARALSEGIPHVRTDFYNVDNRLYFGELTFFHGSGFDEFTPSSFSETMGEWIKLPTGGYLLTGRGWALYLHEKTQTDELPDYKFMCFGGEVKCAFVCNERFTSSGLRVTFYDTDWKVMPFERHYPRSEHPIGKPVTYDEMVGLAEKLAKDIPFARVDFYEIKGRPYFGELTLYPGNGFEEFTPEEWDYILGSWIKVPISDRITE